MNFLIRIFYKIRIFSMYSLYSGRTLRSAARFVCVPGSVQRRLHKAADKIWRKRYFVPYDGNKKTPLYISYKKDISGVFF